MATAAAITSCRRRTLYRQLLRFSPSSASPRTPHFPATISPPAAARIGARSHLWRNFSSDTAVQEILAEVEREKQRERAEKKAAGLEVPDDEEEEDYMGVQPLIDKIERQVAKEKGPLNRYEEATDTDSDEDEDDERFKRDAMNKNKDEFEKKIDKHLELLQNFADADNVDDAFKCMKRIDKFEEKHFRLRLEYRVIGEILNRLKVATGKERFMLIQKANRAMRLVQWKENFDPDNRANYGVIQLEQEPMDSREEAAQAELQALKDENDDEEGVDLGERDKDSILREKLEAIDKKLEEKLAQLDITFGKKGRALEEDIKELAEERNELTQKARKPLYRKGFDVRLVDVKRTSKVTKGGRVARYSVMLACGNYHGVIGFATAKGTEVPIALQKAYEKCFQNLHTVERHEEHTIAHAVQTKYKQTKLYLWPAPTRTGMVASKTVEIILHLAGYRNIKAKVVGSRNPNNTVKAVFKALNAVQTPKDYQETFGRTVVESYLL